MSANDTQVGGTHYLSEYQTWDFIADMKLGYFEGNVVKYVSRWRQKNGLEDLKKAQHYLQKRIELVPVLQGSFTSGCYGWDAPDSTGKEWVTCSDNALYYCKKNDLSPLEAKIIQSVATWDEVDTLTDAARLLTDLIAHAVARGYNVSTAP